MHSAARVGKRRYAGVCRTDYGNARFNGAQTRLRIVHINGSRIAEPRIVGAEQKYLGAVAHRGERKLFVYGIKAYEPAHTRTVGKRHYFGAAARLYVVFEHAYFGKRRYDGAEKAAPRHIFAEGYKVTL